MSNGVREIAAIEVVEDFTSTGKCDEGFLHVRRLKCQNLRADGSRSPVYRVDVIDRPKLDAVAVLVYRRGEKGLEVLLRQNLRPAAYFRAGKPMTVPDPRRYLALEEIVAGLLEPSDQGIAGLKARAVEEVREEGGYSVRPDEIELLGGPYFPVPGILSEKIFLSAVDVTGKAQGSAATDGSPLEEGGRTRWELMETVLDSCRKGEICDGKTELAITRLLARRLGR